MCTGNYQKFGLSDEILGYIWIWCSVWNEKHFFYLGVGTRDVLLRLRSWMQARQRGTGGMSEQEMFQIAKFELLAGK